MTGSAAPPDANFLSAPIVGAAPNGYASRNETHEAEASSMPDVS
jgi:hypothetical protein